MGKGAIIGAIALSFLALITLMNTQTTSRDTSAKQVEYQTGYMARELAMKGRKLVLSSWISNGSAATDFGVINEDGGTIDILAGADLDGSDRVIDYTVRGVYDGTVHEVTSRFRWDALLSNPLQMRVPALDLNVDPSATLNMDTITVDMQSLEDLENVLVDDLALVDSLGALNVGGSYIENEIDNALTTAFGSSSIDVLFVDEAMRNTLDANAESMSYPDQVIQMINDYVNTHPGSQTTLSDDSSMPGTFGTSGPNVLRIQDNVSLSGNLSGQGILVVEGDFVIPAGQTFNWDGIVVVAPPSGQLSGTIDFSGNVNINGSLIIAQDGVPNTGHMDLTVNMDYVSSWLYPWGAWGNSNLPWAQHTHDFSGAYGTQVGFSSTNGSFTVHSNQTKFDSFLSSLSSNDELIFEFYNHQNHGLASLTMQVDGIGLISSRVASGFHELIKSSTNNYKTVPIKVSDIEHLDIVVNRLSALKKLWDDGNDYPNCTWTNLSDSGPDCVGGSYPARYEAFALRVYKWNGASESHVYDASLYWHRRQDEEEDFEDDMNDLVTDIQASNYGMNINLGENTTLTVDQSAMGIIGGILGGGSSAGNIANLGTWHRHWDPGEAGNPLLIANP